MRREKTLKMDPTELRMNLASLQRIDPYIAEILMSSPQVALYKYVGTEWEKTNIEGTLFVYERKCEPSYGFLILNRLSSTNLIQPITKDIELQDKTPFLLFKTKDIYGIWFYEEANCKKLFQIISQVINKLKSGKQQVVKPSGKSVKAEPGLDLSKSSSNGGSSLFDLLNNAGNKEKSQQNVKEPKESPNGGEKLLRLLSISEQRKEEINEAPKANGDSVAAFFAQVSQGNTGPPPGLPINFGAPQTASNPLQNLLKNPGVVSLEALEGGGKTMPPLPAAAKAASDLESCMNKATPKSKKNEKQQQGKKATKNKEENISYASVAAASGQPPQQPLEAPQLMSPMVFAGKEQPTTSVASFVPTPPVVCPPGPGLAGPINGVPFVMAQITPLTEAQLLQAFQHLLRTDRTFISKLHQAYVESMNTQLN